MASDPHFDGRKAVPYDFEVEQVRVPKGVRLFSICGSPVVVPGPGRATRIYVHPDDHAAVAAANAPAGGAAVGA